MLYQLSYFRDCGCKGRDIFLKPANIPQTFFTQKSVHFRQAYKQLLIINSFAHDNLHKKIA